MTNPHYTVTGTPVPFSRGLSSPIRSEYLSIQSGFDSVETELQARVTTFNPTSTGTMTHTAGVVDLDGATEVRAPTPALSVDSTAVATTAWVRGVIGSISGVIPPQAGKDGHVLASDGTTNYWAGGGVAAVNYALFAQGVI
jgi:hypothetical protein